MNASSSHVSPATPPIYTSSRSFGERFSILKRSAKKPNANAGLDTEAQAEIAKPGSNAKTQLPQRRRSLLDTLTEIAKLDDEIDILGSLSEKGSSLPTESRRRRRSMSNLVRGQAVCKILATLNFDDSDDEASLPDSDSDEEAFGHNHNGTTPSTCVVTAADSTRSLLFDGDSRFKCVDDFITLTTDFDKGARPCRRQALRDQQSSSSRRRSSIIDNLATLAESTADLAAGLDDETLPTRK